jgi:subtilase family serine protease
LENELQQFIDDLHDPKSPNFHKWLTAQQFGERLGVAKQDVDAVIRWLESFGFKVNSVYPSFTLIDFSGNASQVRAAFHTEIHYLEVQGARHVANMSEPRIPAALAPAITGIVSLHDFQPHGAHKMRGPSAQFTFPGKSGGTEYGMVPGDLATIYNLSPLFNPGISGQGQTIALIENTNLFSTSDWNSFRSTFGLFSFSSVSQSAVQEKQGFS